MTADGCVAMPTDHSLCSSYEASAHAIRCEAMTCPSRACIHTVDLRVAPLSRAREKVEAEEPRCAHVVE